MGEKYVVNSISAEGDKVVVVLKKDTTIPNDMNADWIKNMSLSTAKSQTPLMGRKKRKEGDHMGSPIDESVILL
jgi:hypothetical protein